MIVLNNLSYRTRVLANQKTRRARDWKSHDVWKIDGNRVEEWKRRWTVVKSLRCLASYARFGAAVSGAQRCVIELNILHV